MGCFVRGGKNGMGCYVRGDKNSMGYYVRSDKKSMGCFVRGGKSLWDVLSGVSKMAWDVLSRDVLSSSPFSTIPLIHSRRVAGSKRQKYVHEVLVTACSSFVR